MLFTVWASVPGRWIYVITRQDRLDVDGFSLSGLLSGVVTPFVGDPVAGSGCEADMSVFSLGRCSAGGVRACFAFPPRG